MKKTARTTKSGYPLMRYLSLLLAMALLFSGVTFARFALQRRGSIDTGVALFDASYTVEGVNSLTFGNQSYWQTLAGGWYAQGGSRTVRIGMRNNSDVEVRANVLHMEGPAEFWDIALQLTTVKEESESETGYAAGEVVTTQYVLADFLRVRGNGKTADGSTSGEEHNFEYGDYYINWDTQTPNKVDENTQDGTFDTGFSDEFGQRGSIEETFQMSGGIDFEDKNGDYGSVTAVRQSARDTANNSTVFSGQDLTITVTASMKEVLYSVGFVRRDGNHSMPAFYLDCAKTVPYYTIEITLPDNYAESENQGDPYFVLDAKNGSDSGETDSLLVFLTWTNSLPSSDLSADKEIAPTPEKLQNIASNGGEFNKAQVTGYHFNYTEVPAQRKKEENEEDITEYITTTVRMNYNIATKTTTWQHVASINSGEGAYPHPLIAQEGGSYVCDGDPAVAVTIAAGVLGIGKYDGSFSSSEFETTTVDNKTVCVAAEKGYAVRFGVDFVQHSELPE